MDIWQDTPKYHMWLKAMSDIIVLSADKDPHNSHPKSKTENTIEFYYISCSIPPNISNSMPWKEDM